MHTFFNKVIKLLAGVEAQSSSDAYSLLECMDFLANKSHDPLQTFFSCIPSNC